MVKSMLESISEAFCKYMNEHYLVLNNDKTQVLVMNSTEQPSVHIGKVLVTPSTRVDVLGFTFNRHLSPAPYMSTTLASARSIAAATKCLSLDLRKPALQQDACALVVGKIGYGGSVLKPHLSPEASLNKDMAAIQTAVNDCGRSIISCSSSNPNPCMNSCRRQGSPLSTIFIVEQIAIETWKGMTYVGPKGNMIPIGNILCLKSATNRATRATT